jgi:hypothetical protein
LLAGLFGVWAPTGLDGKAQLLGPAIPVLDRGPEGLFLRLMLENGDVLPFRVTSRRGFLGSTILREAPSSGMSLNRT